MFKKAFLLPTLISFLVLISVAYREYLKIIEWWDWEDYVDPRTGFEAHDKVIVMGKMTREDTDWVAQYLPE